MPRKAKAISDIASYARQHTEKAVNTLVGIMQSPAATDTARVAAANAILDRGWGKAAQQVSLTQSIEKVEIARELAALFGVIEAKDITDKAEIKPIQGDIIPAPVSDATKH